MTEMIKKAVAAPAGDDPLTYVLSDESVDRMGDIIEAKGWKLGNFLKNPVALFGHDHKFIIGHWTDVKVAGSKLIGKLNLLPAGISERLDEIRAVVEAGVLRAVSVGFASDDAEPMKTGGLRFKSTELLEASLVSVPANPNALQMAKSLDLSDDVKALIFEEPTVEINPTYDFAGCTVTREEFRKAAEMAAADTKAPEIPEAPKDKAATGKSVRVVKLDAPSASAPFVINKIHPERKRA